MIIKTLQLHCGSLHHRFCSLTGTRKMVPPPPPPPSAAALVPAAEMTGATEAAAAPAKPAQLVEVVAQ